MHSTAICPNPPPCPSDVLRIGKLNAHIGDFALREPKAAWDEFRRSYLMGHAPAGQDRYRAVLQAAVNVHHESHDLAPIKLKAIPFDNQRVRFLNREERDRLIASYAAHVQPIILMLAFHGPRIHTVLQMQWGMNGVDLQNEAIQLNHSKNAVIQSVPLHPRVKAALLPMWEARGKPSRGHVFLNEHGQPYQDTRLSPIPGGNLIRRAHATALKRADIEDFTVHDWRHHWASHCVMAGIDLITVMHMGGWKSLRMVQRYVSVSVDHMRAAIHKLE